MVLYSGAGLVFVENRSEGILWVFVVQATTRVKLIKLFTAFQTLVKFTCLFVPQMVNAILTIMTIPVKFIRWEYN